MTECNTQAIPFSRLPRRQGVADFQGGQLTSAARLLLLRDDPAPQTLAGKMPDPVGPLVSPSTLCRLEQRVTRPALFELTKLFVELFRKSFDRSPEEIILDVDATEGPFRLTAGRRNTARPAGGTVLPWRPPERLFPAVAGFLRQTSAVCVVATGQHWPGLTFGNHGQAARRPHPCQVSGSEEIPAGRQWPSRRDHRCAPCLVSQCSKNLAACPIVRPWRCRCSCGGARIIGRIRAGHRA